MPSLSVIKQQPMQLMQPMQPMQSQVHTCSHPSERFIPAVIPQKGVVRPELGPGEGRVGRNQGIADSRASLDRDVGILTEVVLTGF